MQKILASPEMATATRLQQFLTFVVERRLGGAETIKEAELAMAVFHRRASFDPVGDSVVRVAASNLRSRLREYYARSGAQDGVIIDIPKGSYVPVFRSLGTAPAAPRRRPAAMVTAAALCLAAGCGYWAYTAWAKPKAASIAVLPFLNLGAAPGTGDLCDGLVEEISTSLAQAGGLKVVSRSSAFQFRAKGFDVREAGRKLGVETVLEGSVRTAGRRVQVNAQLIQTADGFHLWSRGWEGELAELYRIQQELSQSVASVLKYRLKGYEAAPQSPEAYLQYLKAKSCQIHATPADMAASEVLLRAAIATDPTWAPFHVALADTYSSIAYRQAQPDAELIARAKRSAGEALRLDRRSAEAHAVLAWVRFFYDWDWAGSEKGLREALDYNPNSARALDWLAQRLNSGARFEEALAAAAKAAALDPMNSRACGNVAVVLYCARRYEESLAQARLALQLNPEFHMSHILAGVSLQELGRYAEAERELRAGLEDFPDESDALAHLGAVAMAQGRREEALKILARLETPTPGSPPPAYAIACLRLTLGRKAEAIQALETAIAQRSSDIVVLSVDPALAALHKDAAFRALVNKVGLALENR